MVKNSGALAQQKQSSAWKLPTDVMLTPRYQHEDSKQLQRVPIDPSVFKMACSGAQLSCNSI